MWPWAISWTFSLFTPLFSVRRLWSRSAARFWLFWFFTFFVFLIDLVIAENIKTVVFGLSFDLWLLFIRHFFEIVIQFFRAFFLLVSRSDVRKNLGQFMQDNVVLTLAQIIYDIDFRKMFLVKAFNLVSQGSQPLIWAKLLEYHFQHIHRLIQKHRPFGFPKSYRSEQKFQLYFRKQLISNWQQ